MCTACSQEVCQKFLGNKVGFLEEVCKDSEVLEEVVGVKKYLKTVEELEEQGLVIEWD